MNTAPIPHAPRPVTVPIDGEEGRFPVRRVYCVGRNYVSHIREMAEADERDDPFFFQKPNDAVVQNGSAVAYPPVTSDFEYEGELVLAIGVGGADIPVSAASGHVFGLAAGLDLTRRDRQIEARKRSWPWEMGKSFDASAPIGAIVRSGLDDIAERSLELRVNGEVEQESGLSLMIWPPAEIVSQLSAQYRLEPGDLIMTGTPAGVGPLEPGDLVELDITGLPRLAITVAHGSRNDQNR